MDPTSDTTENRPEPTAVHRRSVLGTLAAVPAALMLESHADMGSAPARAAALGQPPPEWGRNANAWPGYNYDLANTRHTTGSPIKAGNVGRLKVAWRYPLTGVGFWGIIASQPLIADGMVIIQELNSDVTAIDARTGAVKWKHSVGVASPGPNGVAYGYGCVFSVTTTCVFALDARTGAQVWSRELTAHDHGGVDIAPQVYDGTVLVSTVPLNAEFLGEQPGVAGVVYALDARTGAIRWQWSTIQDPGLWGHPDINFGGGLWYPPAVDACGRVFVAVANPGPFPGTTDYPNGTSRPGPNLYSCCLVALDGQTGKVLWYQQVAPHDFRDYDLQISPVLGRVPVGGVPTDVVFAAGKMGKVLAYRASDGHPLWSRSVGRHENDTGLLPDQPVTVYPGALGGVETPMAFDGERLFVPWVDWAKTMSSTTLTFDPSTLDQGRGGLAAFDGATGRPLWSRDFKQMALGAATVTNDVVFTADYAGYIYALNARTGALLWRDRANAGINTSPAIAGDMLLVAAGAGVGPVAGPSPIFPSPVTPELIAYRLT